MILDDNDYFDSEQAVADLVQFRREILWNIEDAIANYIALGGDPSDLIPLVVDPA